MHLIYHLTVKSMFMLICFTSLKTKSTSLPEISQGGAFSHSQTSRHHKSCSHFHCNIRLLKPGGENNNLRSQFSKKKFIDIILNYMHNMFYITVKSLLFDNLLTQLAILTL